MAERAMTLNVRVGGALGAFVSANVGEAGDDQIGSGPALVFREGRVWKATWHKDSAAGITRLIGADGKEIPLVRGRTFFQVVPTGTNVTYKAAS